MWNTARAKVADDLALAIIASSVAPSLLLDGELRILAASASFCDTFGLALWNVEGRPLLALGSGEWNAPQLRSLLDATRSGDATIDAYEMDIPGESAPRRLVLNARKLEFGDAEQMRLLLTISDVTQARLGAKNMEDLLHEKAVLLQELQHRIANSLQIVASVLMQGARRVQSDEARSHLQDAHRRVMSIATLQRQLAVSKLGDVRLRDYFANLCESLGASMIHDRGKLSLTVTTDDSSVNADISISLGLIVTELVINALKHAFAPGRGGTILVEYRANGSGWALSVSDNGVGTPEMLAKARPGLGTSIVEALAHKLRATVEMESNCPGTSVTVTHGAAPPKRNRTPFQAAAASIGSNT